MKPIQRVVIGTQVFWQWLRVSGSVEHPAQGNAIHDAALNCKTDNPSRKLIHHNQNPIRS
jgi:hypothetical protein